MTYQTTTTISEVIHDPAFGDYGRFLFPLDHHYYRGNTLGDLALTWYSHVDAHQTVTILNYLKSLALAGQPIFFDLYTAEEKQQDPTKQHTGLFYFPGKPHARFAICNAGGAFVYVGAIHDSFPHALTLSQKGYHAFALIYRPGAQEACEDLARAIAWVFAHQEELAIDTRCYSLWGGSAGARMAAWLGRYGTAAFSARDCPKAGAVIMQYTGLYDCSQADPPTYACVGDRDGIADWRVMKNRSDRLRHLGIPSECHVFHGLGHGFGLGTGTIAQGWIEQAIHFWEVQM